MRALPIDLQNIPSSRTGVSFVEFVGCLAALAGGVVLGSMYLGVDVKGMAVSVLERSQIVDTAVLDEQETPEQQAEATGEEQLNATEQPEASPETSPAVESETEQSAPISEDLAPAVESEPTDTVEASEEPVELSDSEREAATHAYWKSLAECVQQEARGRQASIKSTENWQLFDYLTHRQKGHQRAVEVIESLDESGVDEKVLAHSQQVLAWQRAGEKLFGRAVDLLTDGPSADLSGPFAQSWQSSATQHRMEEKLIREKHFGVAGYLDHAYKSLAPFKPAAFR